MGGNGKYYNYYTVNQDLSKGDNLIVKSRGENAEARVVGYNEYADNAVHYLDIKEILGKRKKKKATKQTLQSELDEMQPKENTKMKTT